MTEEKKPRGRPPKSEAVRTQRRNRTGEMGGVKSKLRLPPKLEGDPNHVYRWVNDGDEGDRINDLIKYQEYDLVKEDNGVYHSSQDFTGTVKRRVGTKQSGEPMFAYLMRKPKAFYDEDKDLAQEKIDAKMKNIRQGNAPEGTQHSHGYVPKEGIRLRG